jgi:hypothetical protein
MDLVVDVWDTLEDGYLTTEVTVSVNEGRTSKMLFTFRRSQL